MNRIAIAPWRRNARNQAEIARLEARAAALDVIVSTEEKHGRYPGWLVRVRRGLQYVDLRSSGPEWGDPGPLLPVIAGALDGFETQYEGVSA